MNIVCEEKDWLKLLAVGDDSFDCEKAKLCGSYEWKGMGNSGGGNYVGNNYMGSDCGIIGSNDAYDNYMGGGVDVGWQFLLNPVEDLISDMNEGEYRGVFLDPIK